MGGAKVMDQLTILIPMDPNIIMGQNQLIFSDSLTCGVLLIVYYL